MKFLALTAGVASFAFASEITWTLLAQSVTPGLADFPFGSITSTGLLCWYAYHTTVKTIPGLVERFTVQIEKERDHASKEFNKLDERLNNVEDTITREMHELVKAVHAMAVSQKERGE